MTDALSMIALFCSCITGVAAVIALAIAMGKKAKAPNRVQDDRIAELERRVSHHDEILDRDNVRLKRIEEGNRVTQRALLALLSSAVGETDIDQLKKVRNDLNNYLIEV